MFATRRALRVRIAELEAENERLRAVFADDKTHHVSIHIDGRKVHQELLKLQRLNGGTLGLA